MPSPEVLNLVAANLDTLSEIVKSAASLLAEIIAASAVLAAVLPKPGQSSPLAPLRQLLDLAALNIGHAKNKDTPP